MAEEFQAGVCGSTWWNPARSSLGFSPCLAAINDTGSFGWQSELVGMKARSSTDESDSVSDGSTVFQDIQKPRQPDSGAGLLMNSTTDWNQTRLSVNGGTESNYHSSFLQEDMNSSLNFRHERGMDCPEIQKEWSTMKNVSVAGGQDSTINEFKQTNGGFSLDEPTCDGLPTSFPMSPASYGYPSTLLQTLFDTDPQPPQSLFENRSMNYPATTNYRTNLNEFSPKSLAKLSPLLRPSLPKQQATSPLHLKNSTPFWNDSTAALTGIRASFFPSEQAQFLPSTFKEELSCPNLTTKPNNEVVQDSDSMVKKSCGEPAFKRPRIETPSPLPTFKVRKEKLGDRITALQQLVSPFGKTDTASVLQEAIEYIKFLHEQVTVLSTPYIQNGAPIQHQQTSDKLKEPQGPKQDLRSRGLCLVPISSTFPVATETTGDFWTPSFGRAFR